MIIISRTSQFSNKFVPIHIYIDGQKAGSLRDGERAEFRVVAGEHTLQAKVNISASNPIQFEIGDKRNIDFELGSNINVMKNVLIALSHPALLMALFFADKIIKWDYFLVFGMLAFLAFETWSYILRKRKNSITPENEKYYLYLKRTDQT